MKNPRSILITGASSGIGEALAKKYSGPGVLLGLTGRNMQRLSDVAKVCEKLGAEVVFETIDVQNRIKMHDFIRRLERKKSIDLVFANAGISNSTASSKLNYEDIEDEIVAVNILGVLNTVRPALELMKLHQNGQIVIISSLAAYSPTPGAAIYGATKVAIKNLGLALRTENREFNIGITVICPGFVDTLMTENLIHPLFIISSKKAANIIYKKIIKNPKIISFPTSTLILLLVSKIIPDRIIFKIISSQLDSDKKTQ
tara:strand:- start:120484 stop:121257 length:774 start_codon:yes stop_codon:yes gene_type:complete